MTNKERDTAQKIISGFVENPFNQNILKKFPVFTWKDFQYFTEESENKVKKLGLPVSNCGINNIYVGTNEESYNRCCHCLTCCGLRCLQGQDYKKLTRKVKL